MFQADVVPVAAGFTWAWHWDWATALVVAAIELAYLIMWAGVDGTRRVHLPWVRLVAATAGVVAIALTDMSPIGVNDEKFLSMHMVGHDVYIWIAAPLMVWGLVPLFGAGDKLPTAMRQLLILLTHPVVAWVASTMLLWIWHLPVNYDRALSNRAIHGLEHACFITGYVIYWWPLIAAPGAVGGLHTNAARAGYLLAGAMQSALLGALIMFHGSVIYPHYLDLPGLAGSSSLADQGLAGAIMLFPGAAVFVLAAAFFIMPGNVISVNTLSVNTAST